MIKRLINIKLTNPFNENKMTMLKQKIEDLAYYGTYTRLLYFALFKLD